MQLDAQRNERVCRLVYCGPGMAGKTTNLEALIATRPGGTAQGPVATDLHSERTLHVLFAAPELDLPGQPPTRVEAWTVPGVSYYAATRKAVLQDADGVVFVADSRREAMDENIDAMNEMLANIRQLGLGDDLPVVIQYNKADAPTAVPAEQLEPLLNIRNWPTTRAVATTGQGVAETLRLVVAGIRDRAAARSEPAPPAEAPAPPRAWLIACFRCQTMLEVPVASPGTVYTCGSCQAVLEVVDAERGLTRAAAAPPVSGGRTRHDDSDGYAATTQGGREDSGALARRGGAASGRGSVAPAPGGDPPVVDGFETIGTLDESPLGRRMQLRELAGGRLVRALQISPAALALPGYAEGLEPYIRLAGPIRHPNLLLMNAYYPLPAGAVLVSQDAPDYEHIGRVLARRRVIAPPHAIHIARQVALVLEEAARQGVVHGWLRPENVLVGPDGQVLLDDLCLPKPHRFLIRELSGASAATEYYLAPEHLGEETRSDIRSDMFCLGALLFRMITGDGLVTGYNPHEALHKLIANGARPLRAAGAPVSRELDAFFKRLVATERRDRFQTWREVIDQAERFGGGAKRQTMRITGGFAAGGKPAQTRSLTAPTAGSSRRAGMTGVRRGDSSAGTLRPAHQGPAGPAARGRRGPGVGVIVVLLACALALGGGIAWFALGTTQRAPAPAAAAAAPAPARPVPAPGPAPAAASIAPPPAGEPRAAAPDAPAPAAGEGAAVASGDPPAAAVSPAPAAPVDEAAPAAPAVAAVPAPETSGMALPALNEAISSALMGERYAEALAMAKNLPEPLRGMREAAIANAYKAKRQDLIRYAAAGDTIRLQNVLGKVAAWGMDANDPAWAEGLLAQATSRQAQGGDNAPRQIQPKPLTPTPPRPEPPPAERPPKPVRPVEPAKPAEPVKPPEPAKPPVAAEPPPDPGREALRNAVPNLLNGNANAVRSAAANLGETPSGRALTRLADLSSRRVAVLEQAIAAKARIRLQHPVTREECDVTGATEAGLTLANAAGSASQVAWTSIPDRAALAMIWDEALKAGAPTPADRATAAAMLASLGQPAFAKLALRPARSSLDPQILADLDHLIQLAEKK